VTGRSWRWGAVAASVAVLAALPSAVGALPAAHSDVSAEQLRARVRASAAVAWSGTSESRGGVALPDVQELGDLPGLLGGTVRTRTWWRGPADWRVDEQRLTGEQDVIVQGARTTTWDSADNTVERLFGELPVRLPRAADLLAPVLGRRLAGARDAVASRLPERRVAGRSAAGLRLVPSDPAASTVASVDLWADPQTGLPLLVELRAEGQERPVLTTLVLDLDLDVPPAARTAFRVPRTATVTTSEVPDLAAQIDRAVPYALPALLAGAPRAGIGGLQEARGVGTYGGGLASYAVVPLPPDVAFTLLRRLSATGGNRITTPLVNGLVDVERDRSYLLVGTVPQGQLDAALAELRADPPPRTDGS